MKRWTETEPRKKWVRADGAKVHQASLFCFHATTPDGILLQGKKGPRFWTSPEAAMSKIDEEIPLQIPPEREEPSRPSPEENQPDFPSFMECGHLDCYTEGERCLACERRDPPNYRYLSGKFSKPVPANMRRTRAKIDMGGFPGLCCDEDGLYIGGHLNDCRRISKERCEVHQDEVRPLKPH